MSEFAQSLQSSRYSQIIPNLYRIPVPLVGPLKELNAYLIAGGERYLLVDTGFNLPKSKAALLGALNELSVPMDRVDILVTHLHADHSGLAAEIAVPGTRFFSSKIDGEDMNSYAGIPNYWETQLEKLWEQGMDRSMIEGLATKHPGRAFGPQPLDFIFLKEGDRLHYGDFELLVLEMPGHTRGLLCLYDAEHRIFFSSDHILGDITPNITYQYDGDTLGHYLDSLDKADSLAMDLALPGHRSLISDPHGRIQELRVHHAVRLNEIRNIIGSRSMTPLEVASEMTWSMRGISWLQFPLPQKYFACGEAFAHLMHLYTLGELESEMRDGILFFRKAK